MNYRFMRNVTLLDTNEESILIAGIDDITGAGKFLVVNVTTPTPAAWVADEANRVYIESEFDLILETDNRAKLWLLGHDFNDAADNELDWLQGEIDFLVVNIETIVDVTSKRLATNQLRILRQNKKIIQYIQYDMSKNLKDDRV